MEERGFEIVAPDEEEPDRDSEVFYNNEMLENRDISAIAGKVFAKIAVKDEFYTCDALAASGVRGFRYSEFSDKLLLNDVNPSARENIVEGLQRNGIEAKVTGKDANVILSENRNRFHLIDIDPFGSFSNFLDSTARAANHSSFVGLTATDNAAPAGSYSKVCQRRYGSKPLKNSFKHETGLRIYIKEVFENFARFDKAFDPKICFHKRHYSRVMGRVTESKSRCNRSLENIGYLSFCPECLWRRLERKEACENCGNEELRIAGPLWTGKFVDHRFTEKMLEEMPEEWESSYELLEKLHNGGEIVTPYYDLHNLCSNMGISSPKRDPVMEKLYEIGYPVSRTHFSPTGFRTDAPIDQIKSVVRELQED